MRSLPAIRWAAAQAIHTGHHVRIQFTGDTAALVCRVLATHPGHIVVVGSGGRHAGFDWERIEHMSPMPLEAA